MLTTLVSIPPALKLMLRPSSLTPGCTDRESTYTNNNNNSQYNHHNEIKNLNKYCKFRFDCPFRSWCNTIISRGRAVEKVTVGYLLYVAEVGEFGVALFIHEYVACL